MSRVGDKLRKLCACEEACRWADGFKTQQAAWDACEYGAWLLWWCGKMAGPPGSKSRKKLVRVSCTCVRTEWKWMSEPGKHAIRTAEAYCKGEASLEDVRKAASATAYTTSAAPAAYATAYAASAAYATAYAAYAASAASAAASAATPKRCAEIVLEQYPRPPRRRLEP